MFESALWERMLSPARAMRWRLQRWSSERDRAFWDREFDAPAHDPFSPSYPGRVTSMASTWRMIVT